MKKLNIEPRAFATLQRLMNTISPSGYEEEAARVWQAEARTFADAVHHDVHGNSMAVVNRALLIWLVFVSALVLIGWIR